MTKRCCVPGCKSNHRRSQREGYVTSFMFPTNQSVRDKWLHSIGRDNWLPSRKSVVCVKHFIASDVIREEVYKDKNGVVRQYPRRRPMLRPGAVPKFFLGSSSHHAPKRSFGEPPRTELPLSIGERNQKGSLETNGNYNDKDELVPPESVILVPGGDMDESEGDDDNEDDNSIFNYDVDPLDVDNYCSPQESKSDVHESIVLSKFGALSVEESIQEIAPWILDHSYVKTVPSFIASNTVKLEFGSSSIKNHTPRSERRIVHCTPGFKKGNISSQKQPQSSPRLTSDSAVFNKAFSINKQLVQEPWDSHIDISPEKGSKEAIVREKNGRSDKRLPLSKSFTAGKTTLSGNHSSLQNSQRSLGRAKFAGGKVSKKPKRDKPKLFCRTPEDINETIELKESSCNSKIQESSRGVIFEKGTMQCNKKVQSNAVVSNESFSENYEEIDLEADENCKSNEVDTTRSLKILKKCDEKQKYNSQLEGMEKNEHLMQITTSVEKQDKQVRMEAFPTKQIINSVQEPNVEENVGEENTLQRLGTIGGFVAKSRGRWNRKRCRGRGRKAVTKSFSGRIVEDCNKNKTTCTSISDICFTPKTLHRRTSSRIIIADKKMVGPNGKSVVAAVSQKEKFGDGVKFLVHSSFSPRVVLERNLNLRSDRKTTLSASEKKSPSLDTPSSNSSINDNIGMVSSDNRKGNAILSKDIHFSMSDSVIPTQQDPKERCGVPVGLTSRRRGRLRGNGRLRQVVKRNVTSTERKVSLRAKINDQVIETATVVGPVELRENDFALRVTRSSSEKGRNEVNNNSGKEEIATISTPNTRANEQKRKISLKVVEPETSGTLRKVGECESTHGMKEKSVEVGFTDSSTSMQVPSSRGNSLCFGQKRVLGRRRRRKRGRGVMRGKTRGRLNSLLSSQEKIGARETEHKTVSSPSRAVCEKSDSGNNAVLTVEQDARLNGNVSYEEDCICEVNDLPLDNCNNGPVIVHVSSLRSESDILKHVNSDLEFISDSSEDDIPIIMDIMSLSEESEESNSSEIFSSHVDSHNHVTDGIGQQKSLFNKVDEDNSTVVDAVQERKHANNVLPDPCPYCHMHFVDALTALTHSRNCLKSLTRHVISCHVCDRLYVRMEDLDAHMKIHQKEFK